MRRLEQCSRTQEDKVRRLALITDEQLQAILIEVGGDDTMSYGLGTIIEAMRRAYSVGMRDGLLKASELPL